MLYAVLDTECRFITIACSLPGEWKYTLKSLSRHVSLKGVFHPILHSCLFRNQYLTSYYHIAVFTTILLETFYKDTP